MEENVLSAMYMSLSGMIEKYTFLKHKTSIFNEEIKKKFPEQMESLRLDAHHIIEARQYERFKNILKKIGWTSSDQMPAIAVHYISHIRSPKKIKELTGLKVAQETSSLSWELYKSVSSKHYKNVLEMINAYEEFYKKTAWGEHLGTFFGKLKRDIQTTNMFPGTIGLSSYLTAKY